MKMLEWIQIGAKILFWCLSVILIYWLILKLTGHSPTTDQVIITLLVALCTTFAGFVIFSIRFTNKVCEHIGKVNQYMKESDRRFFALARDFKKHLEKCH